MVEQRNLPFMITALSEDDQDVIKNVCTKEFVQIGEEKWFTHRSYIKYGHEFYNFSVRSDDVWLLGFTRSGTTVSQEIVWLICNDMDTDMAKQLPLIQRFCTLENIMYFNKEVADEKTKKITHLVQKSYKELFDMSDRRFIKSHLPFSVLPQNLAETGCKIIYLIREPKDVIVSNYHFFKQLSVITSFAKFSDFWKVFKMNLVVWGPYFEHLKQAWQLRGKKNVLIVFYDELINSQRKTIRTIASFLEKELTEEQIDTISKYCKKTFTKSIYHDNKSDDEKTFVNEENKWKKYFVGDLEMEVEEWIKENVKDTGLRFFSNAENK